MFFNSIALSNKNNELRKYYLKNLSSVKILEENFVQEKEIDKLLENSISIWFEEKVKPFEVKLFLSKTAAKYFQRKPISKTQIIESLNQDGSLELIIKITHEMEILPIIKYWIPHIKVLSPLSLKDRVKKDLEKYLKEIN